ncbi:hypothetical protein [Cellulomonas sp. P5_C6]
MTEATLDLVRPVPAWMLRGVLALLAAGTLVVAFVGPGPRAHWLLVGALVALVTATVLQPGVGTAAVVVAAAATRVLAGDPPALGVLMALVLLVHLTVWLGAVAARTSWRTQVELAVVGRGLRDVAVVQVGVQVLTVVATLLVGVRLGDGDLWRAVALVAAIVATAALLPRAPS